jgi:pyruvate,water dikinase
MRKVYSNLSTGLSGLDDLFTGLLPGDNVVWQVDAIADTVAFAHPFCKEATAERRPLVYFRFADHERLLPSGVSAQVYELRPEKGFESFIAEIFDVVERVGAGTFYLFDSLSELAVDWYSDRMLANFFLLTCPYLFSYDTVAYFSLIRGRNTSIAIDAIHATAQIVLDVYRKKERLYLHPLKVDRRHSDTMYMLHAWQDDGFEPVRSSAATTRILSSVQPPKLGYSIGGQDIWTRTFSKAESALSLGASQKAKPRANKRLIQRLVRMAVTRDPQLLRLADKYFELDDLVNIGKRMIGTGLIGGKAVGMLLARAILRRSNRKWVQRLEAHDSFFVGTDVFYTYLVVNQCWWVRRQLKHPATALDKAQEAKERILAGSFPKDIQDQFAAMLDYFGQSPVILRSSSLLEDAYGNAFSGTRARLPKGSIGSWQRLKASTRAR